MLPSSIRGTRRNVRPIAFLSVGRRPAHYARPRGHKPRSPGPDGCKAFRWGAACRPLRAHCRRTRKGSAAEPQPNRGTAILAVSVTGGTPMDRGRLPVPQRRGAPRGCPEVGDADGRGRHEACPYVCLVIELRKV